MRACDRYVDVTVLRAIAVAQTRDGRVTWKQLAQRLGYQRLERGRRVDDPTRLRRQLGLVGARDGRRSGLVAHASVGPLCEALGVDPVDLGL